MTLILTDAKVALCCQEINENHQTLHTKMYYNEEWELRIMENRKEQLVWKIAIFIPHLQMFLFNGDAR